MTLTLILSPHSFLTSIADRCKSLGDHSELFLLPISNQADEATAYLNRASAELTCAISREAEGDASAALSGYRTVVDILMTGVKGERTECLVL